MLCNWWKILAHPVAICFRATYLFYTYQPEPHIGLHDLTLLILQRIRKNYQYPDREPLAFQDKKFDYFGALLKRKWFTYHIDELNESQAKGDLYLFGHILHWPNEFVVSPEEIANKLLFLLRAWTWIGNDVTINKQCIKREGEFYFATTYSTDNV